MNYLLSLLFLILIFSLYFIIGDTLSKYIRTKRNSFANKIIIGFITVFLLGFLIGFPLQVFSLSWLFFAILFIGVLIAISVFIIKKRKDIFKRYLNHLQEDPKGAIFRHLKRYWFVYLLVIVFSLLSCMNTQPYYLNNYRDDYYISKIVNLVGEKHLLSEDYGIGIELARTSLFSYAKIAGYRIFNTYELTYSVLGSLFHISLPFFCRFTMVIHNYLICFMTYTLFTSLFVDDNFAQYGNLFFCLLMIPAGFAASGMHPIAIRMFENWRFQTGIFYGGSITRVLSLPLLFYYGEELFAHNHKANYLFLLAITLTLTAFQTNAICYVILYLPLLVLGKIISYIINKSSQHASAKIVITIAIFFSILVMGDMIMIRLPFDTTKLVKNAVQFSLYYANVFTYDFFALIGLVALAMLLVFEKDHNARIIEGGTLLLFLMFRFNKNSMFLSLITSNFYGIARELTSVLMLMAVFMSIFIVRVLARLPKKEVILSLLALVSVVGTLGYIRENKENILHYTNIEDNMTKKWYSPRILLDNDKMLPEISVKVGQYFDKLKGDHYYVVCEQNIPYEGTILSDQSILLSSNKIQLFYGDPKNVNEYLEGKKAYKYIKAILEAYHCQFILTTRPKIAKDLSHNGYCYAIKNTQKHYYLMKKK